MSANYFEQEDFLTRIETIEGSFNQTKITPF